ncbi:hypothetical protein [Anaeroglobus sp. AF13-6AC]|uniref:hypothetical protein n=1 Tax=Anaeroglobus sp. AF13-6AC TaxID=2997918 RepID=UPI0022E5ECB3|nr:hypothetical protein [Anaeroglobus sp. AF13-6AC]
MNDGRLRNLVRGAILLALAVVLQGMRLIIPVPTPISMFLIGSAVNACLVLIARTTGRTQGVTAAVLLPVFAWLEGMLPLWFFIFPVMVGNIVFVLLVNTARGRGIYGAAFVKAFVLYSAFFVLLQVVEVPNRIGAGILFVMSWPQIVTGLIGIGIALYAQKRLAEVAKK